ncbi:lysine 2,3-aminomutase YodO family protein [Luminiphilus syltensis NOR5-1B]|uniref:L-lysine 2,3-aminomutase n=1 Tax=Luminiphilus syltensis NOR5-1B TaxID=565045 RepID=B8KUW2_9GAMM|nr:EF-P beta-lysylation protein EpmB [Luminiphilus syltensis]EED36078.1 lysine 2,3-aminomutase YodO family protein [Luminiphilus syltensis NOR5-1B]
MTAKTALAADALLARESAPWQTQLRNAVRSVSALLDSLNLTPADVEHGEPKTRGEDAERAAQDFPVRAPQSFIDRMRPGDPNDPLLRQVLAVSAEQQHVPGYVEDPLQERDANPTPGIVHKYQGRLLLMPTAACAVHCRYCFRRHFPYADNRLDEGALDRAMDYLASQPEVTEVILSGGDPLILDDAALGRLIDRLESLGHLSRLRIHSRLPVVLPDRLTEALAERLDASRLSTSLVLHGNHPAEIDAGLTERLQRWRPASLTLLNQSVLLAGVNDDPAVLIALSERLFEAGVLPYYLHLLDPVAGVGHFAVADEQALAIYRQMAAKLPGYLLPKLARELPDLPSKTTYGLDTLAG